MDDVEHVEDSAKPGASVTPAPYRVAMLDDYVLTGRGNQLTVTRDGVIVGWLSNVYSGGRRMWHFSPTAPLPGAPEPPMPSETAMGALEAWIGRS